MEDPLPENIEGRKRVVHTVEHRVNWGYVAAATAVLAVLVVVGSRRSSRADDSEAYLSE
jgi:hypothetical protein